AEHMGVSRERMAAAHERHATLHGAIAAVGDASRQLRPLTEAHDLSEAVVDAISVTDPERPVAFDELAAELAPDPDPADDRARPWAIAGAVLAASLGLTLAWRYPPLSEWVSVDGATRWVDGLAGNRWAPLVIVLAYTPASVIMFPRPLITVVAGMMFGVLLGL